MALFSRLSNPSSWFYKALLFVNAALFLVYLGFWGIALRQDLLWRADFTAYYTGGALVRDGLGAQLYDLELQARYQQEILGGKSFKDGLLPFNSPPHMALMLLPLTYLPLSVAFWIWTLAEVGLLAWVIALMLQLTNSWLPHERRLWIGILLAFPPLMLTLMQGAFSLLTLVAALQIYLALKNDQPRRAGIWLAVGLLRPHVLLPMGLFVLLQRRWRSLLWAVPWGAGIVGGTALLLGGQVWVGFLNMTMKTSEFFDAFGVYPGRMYNLKGTLFLWLGKGAVLWINRVSLASFVLYVLAMVWLWSPPLHSDHPAFELRLALGLTLGLLFGLHVNPHDGLMLLLPMLWLYLFLSSRASSQYVFLWFAALCPLLLFLSEFVVRGALGIRIPVLVMLLLSVWMGRSLWKEDQPGHDRVAIT